MNDGDDTLLRDCRRALLMVVLLACLLAFAGCSSREARGKTAADTWHIGHAMDTHAERLPPATIRLMGQTLKQIADRWAEDIRVEIVKPTQGE